jgi:hypothetical protein
MFPHSKKPTLLLGVETFKATLCVCQVRTVFLAIPYVRLLTSTRSCVLGILGGLRPNFLTKEHCLPPYSLTPRERSVSGWPHHTVVRFQKQSNLTLEIHGRCPCLDPCPLRRVGLLYDNETRWAVAQSMGNSMRQVLDLNVVLYPGVP